MLLSGIAYLACGCLYMIRAKPESLVEDAQVLLRLPLQIFCYLLSTVLFSRHIGLDNMGLCSPFFEGYSSLEALLIYLLWMASCVVVVVVVVAGVGRVGVRSSFPSPLTHHPSPSPPPPPPPPGTRRSPRYRSSTLWSYSQSSSPWSRSPPGGSV